MRIFPHVNGAELKLLTKNHLAAGGVVGVDKPQFASSFNSKLTPHGVRPGFAGADGRFQNLAMMWAGLRNVLRLISFIQLTPNPRGIIYLKGSYAKKRTGALGCPPPVVGPRRSYGERPGTHLPNSPVRVGWRVPLSRIAALLAPGTMHACAWPYTTPSEHVHCRRSCTTMHHAIRSVVPAHHLRVWYYVRQQ